MNENDILPLKEYCQSNNGELVYFTDEQFQSMVGLVKAEMSSSPSIPMEKVKSVEIGKIVADRLEAIGVECTPELILFYSLMCEKHVDTIIWTLDAAHMSEPGKTCTLQKWGERWPHGIPSKEVLSSYWKSQFKAKVNRL